MAFHGIVVITLSSLFVPGAKGSECNFDFHGKWTGTCNTCDHKKYPRRTRQRNHQVEYEWNGNSVIWIRVEARFLALISKLLRWMVVHWRRLINESESKSEVKLLRVRNSAGLWKELLVNPIVVSVVKPPCRFLREKKFHLVYHEVKWTSWREYHRCVKNSS